MKQPIYFFFDESTSAIGYLRLIGENLLETAFRQITNDPYLLESAWVSVSLFGVSVTQCVPYAPVYDIKKTNLSFASTQSSTHADVGLAVEFLCDSSDEDARWSRETHKRVYPPIVFFVSGSKPFNVSSALSQLKTRSSRIDLCVNIVINNSIHDNSYEELTPNAFFIGTNGSKLGDVVYESITTVQGARIDDDGDERDPNFNSKYPWLDGYYSKSVDMIFQGV